MQPTVRPVPHAEIYPHCADEQPTSHARCPVNRPGLPPAGRCDCSCHDPRRPGPA